VHGTPVFTPTSTRTTKTSEVDTNSTAEEAHGNC